MHKISIGGSCLGRSTYLSERRGAVGTVVVGLSSVWNCVQRNKPRPGSAPRRAPRRATPTENVGLLKMPATRARSRSQRELLGVLT